MPFGSTLARSKDTLCWMGVPDAQGKVRYSMLNTRSSSAKTCNCPLIFCARRPHRSAISRFSELLRLHVGVAFAALLLVTFIIVLVVVVATICKMPAAFSWTSRVSAAVISAKRRRRQCTPMRHALHLAAGASNEEITIPALQGRPTWAAELSSSLDVACICSHYWLFIITDAVISSVV